MRKKILYILPEYNANATTHYVHIFELLERLGKDLDIFLLVEESVGQPVIKNLKKIYVPRNFLDRFLTIIRARSLGYKKAYVHYSYWGAILSSLVFRPTGGKVFYWHCEVYDQFFSDFKLNLESLKKKLLDEYLMVLTLKMVNYLVTGTPTVGKFYEKQFNLPKNKVKIVPNWINPARFEVNKNKEQLRRVLGLPKNKKIVLFLHRLAPRKGADLLPKIIKGVSLGIPDVYFVIAGEGPTRQNLEVAIKQNKIANAKLVGAVPNIETPKYFAAADIFILPSRQEGFPRILIECMAAGLPFVAMNVAGTKDIINKEQKQYLVPKGDLKIFIQKTINLLQQPRELHKLSISGKKQVVRYHINNVTEQFIKLLNS